MAQMREIKLRMGSVKQTKQITKAMKLISASKMKKAKKQYEDTLPFYNKVKEVMADILNNGGKIDNIFFGKEDDTKEAKKAYFVLSGDKGLAGGYNSNIIKLVERELKDIKKETRLYVAGYVGRQYFRKKKYDVDDEFDYPVQNPTITRAREISEMFLKLFKKGIISELNIIYTKVVTGTNFQPQKIRVLPLNLEDLKKELGLKNDREVTVNSMISYEPSASEVFNVLIEKYVKGIVYGVLVEAFASEQTSRMTAMDSATRNADEMLKKLDLFYNRARQAAITQEISEIVGGANAL